MLGGNAATIRQVGAALPASGRRSTTEDAGRSDSPANTNKYDSRRANKQEKQLSAGDAPKPSLQELGDMQGYEAKGSHGPMPQLYSCY